MLHKTFMAGLLLSVAFVPQAFAGFEFVSPVAPVAASQQAKPDQFVSAPIAAAPKATPTVTPATPTLPKMQGLMKPANFVPAVKADQSDALLLSDEVLAQPPKNQPTQTLPSTLSSAPAVVTPVLPPAVVTPPAPKVASGAALPPIVQADTTAIKAAPVTYEVAQGFGKQVPLALALRQIVPASYRFSFASGVNAGQMVDWQGGAPWDQVVSRVAKENALLVRITNQVVLIEQDPNGVRAPVLGAYSPTTIVPALLPLGAIDVAKKAPAFAGDNPLVVALGETLPTSDTEDMSLNQPRRSFQATVPLTAALPTTPAPMQVKAPALPTALVAVDKPVVIATPVAKATAASMPTDKLLAEKALQPALEPVTPAAVLPPSLPPLPKARTIDVAAATPALPVANTPKAMVAPPAPTLPVIKPVTKPAALPPLEATEVKAAPTVMPVLNSGKAIPQAIETAKAVQQTWVAEKGQTMRQAFAAWAPDAGVTLIWSAAYDYPLQTDVAINGTFQDAIRTMLDGFSKAQPRPVGRLHNNGATGNAVLVVETRQATE